MAIRVLFLGLLQDNAGAPEREFPAPLDWAGLLDGVDPITAEELRQGRVHLACNGQILTDRTALQAQDGDEIALLPPVSGG